MAIVSTPIRGLEGQEARSTDFGVSRAAAALRADRRGAVT